MKQLHVNLFAYEMQDKSLTERQLLAIWNSKSPHFGGAAMHRYDGSAREYLDTKSTEQVCVYCLRPRLYKGQIKVS